MGEKDSFPANDNISGIQDSGKIKIIICYCLSSCPDGIKRDTLQKVLYENSIANYFEVSNCLDELISSKDIEEKDGRLFASDGGRKIARDLSVSLSSFMKAKAVSSAQKALLLERRKRENSFDIEKDQSGQYKITIRMSSAFDSIDSEFLNLTLTVGDYERAEIMRSNFYNNPVRLYENIIDALTSDNDFKS